MTILLNKIAARAPHDTAFHQLDQVSCEFHKGTISLIAGPAGAGKSTLLDIISGLRKPDSGDVYVEGTPIWNQGKSIGADTKGVMVFQQPEQQLFARTIRGEFAYSLKPLRLTKGEAEARMHNAMNAMELPLELLERNPFSLSGGEKRRAAIGTALALEPEWLFLDEPSAGLDPDASKMLTEYLISFKEQGGGVILASHDIDTFLPLADRVLLLNEGHVMADVTQEELCRQPHLLLDAGLTLPDSLLTAKLLREYGLLLPFRLLEPAELAALLIPQIGDTGSGESSTVQSAADERQEAGSAKGMASRRERTGSAERSLGFAANDPRALWICYMLLSIAILTQKSLLGMLFSGSITAAIVFMSRVHVRSFWRAVVPFVWLMAISASFSGLVFTLDGSLKVSFSAAAAATTLITLMRLLFVLALGILLPLVASTIRMKRGLEQGLYTLNRLKIPVEALALAASLLFRFVPLILSELDRFSRIARSRGKSRAKPGYLHVRDLPAIMIPLLGSLLKTADDFAFAMEMRGYSRIGQHRTSSIKLLLNRGDYKLMLACMLLSIALFAAGRWGS
jgi:energy-coupling factor transporter ATP-binding protein EcfA2/energy-coupling factor transporter transmembrane protein EcfT